MPVLIGMQAYFIKQQQRGPGPVGAATAHAVDVKVGCALANLEGATPVTLTNFSEIVTTRNFCFVAAGFQAPHPQQVNQVSKGNYHGHQLPTQIVRHQP